MLKYLNAHWTGHPTSVIVVKYLMLNYQKNVNHITIPPLI